ncbi:hypothetical protein [Streptomyces sp. NPDC006971]|uniref:hypothetical protein n=1 Tax=Streptomyces sp. NPDC006971 TaxID=3154784 RepID=UPI0033CD773F
MATSAADDSVLAQWEAILAAAAPELIGHVQAVGFDVDTGRLDVTPAQGLRGRSVVRCFPKLSALFEQGRPH